MKGLEYGKNYQYAHSFEGNFVKQEFLPSEISGTKFYEPSDNSTENKIKAELIKKWGDKY